MALEYIHLLKYDIPFLLITKLSFPTFVTSLKSVANLHNFILHSTHKTGVFIKQLQRMAFDF